MDEIKNTIRSLIAEQLKLKIDPATIRDDIPLFGAGSESLGLDSLDALDLTLIIESHFGVEVIQEQLISLATLNSLARFIQDHIQQPRGDLDSVPTPSNK